MSDKYNHWLGKFLARLNGCQYYAITLGQTVYYSFKEELVDLYPELVRHENQHKVQWRRDGRIKFACKYIWWNITKGYYHNPYEVEARSVAAKKVV